MKNWRHSRPAWTETISSYIALGMTALLMLILQYRRCPQKRDRGQLNFIVAGVALRGAVPGRAGTVPEQGTLAYPDRRFAHIDIGTEVRSDTGHTHYRKTKDPTLLSSDPAGPGVRSTLQEVELLGLIADNVTMRLATFRLQRRLEHDDLTGLLRPENILDQIRKATLDYLAGNGAFSIAMLDLDDFKTIDDGHGHLFGGRVLRQMGELMRSMPPPSERAGHFGGEEFLILCPNGKRDENLALMEELRGKMKSIRIESLGAERLEISISIGMAGVAEIGHADGDVRMATRRLIGLADERLYLAKKQSKGRCVA